MSSPLIPKGLTQLQLVLVQTQCPEPKKVPIENQKKSSHFFMPHTFNTADKCMIKESAYCKQKNNKRNIQKAVTNEVVRIKITEINHRFTDYNKGEK